MIDYHNMKMLLESILLEDKLSNLQSRYSHIHPDTIKDIWNNGVPSNNQGKYIDWSIKENIKNHNPSRTKNALEIYDRNKDKIGKFNHQWSINDLENITHPFTDEGKSFNKKAEEGTSTHYEDSDIIIKQHNNHPSAVKGGFLHVDNSCYNNTKEPGKAEWCVSANSELGEQHFNKYTLTNPLYTVENKKNKTKTAIVYPNELRNEHDDSLLPYQVVYRHPNIINSDLGNRLLNMGDTKEILDKVPVNASENQLLKGLNDNDSNVRSAAVSHPKASEQVLLKGLNDSNSDVRSAAVSHPNATTKVLSKASNDSNWRIRSAVVSHPKATEQMLLSGLNDDAWAVRHKAASNINASQSVLLKALDNESEDVNFGAALHPKATEAVLLKAMNKPSSNARLRAAAVDSNNATEKVLQLGLNDNHYHVRMAVVNNPNTPAHILQQALNDEEPMVKTIARSKLEQMKKLP